MQIKMASRFGYLGAAPDQRITGWECKRTPGRSLAQMAWKALLREGLHGMVAGGGLGGRERTGQCKGADTRQGTTGPWGARGEQGASWS